MAPRSASPSLRPSLHRESTGRESGGLRDESTPSRVEQSAAYGAAGHRPLVGGGIVVGGADPRSSTRPGVDNVKPTRFEVVYVSRDDWRSS